MTRCLAPVLFLASLAGNARAGAADWIDLQPYPIPISNNAVSSVCDGGTCTVYSFMGIVNPFNAVTITPRAYKLSSDSPDSWVQIANAPTLAGLAKIGASAVSCGGSVYLIGGYTASGGPEVTEPRLFRYDPADDTYTQLADVPVEVDDTVAAVYQDRYIYLISGWHGPINNNVPNVQVFDTVRDTWQQATPIPGPGRFGHAGGLVQNRLVIIDGVVVGGGFSITHSTLVGTIDDADPAVIAWNVGSPNPGSPTYRAAASLSSAPCNRVLFVGGTDNPYNFSGIGYNGQPASPLDQVLSYNPLTDHWTLIDDGGKARHVPTMDHRGLVAFGNRWATVGGMTAPGLTTAATSGLWLSSLGDLDGDGLVNSADLAGLLGGWGPCADCPADLDGDGAIDAGDLAVLLGNWGPCP